MRCARSRISRRHVARAPSPRPSTSAGAGSCCGRRGRSRAVSDETRRSASTGLGLGVLIGIALGFADALAAARGAFGDEAQALWVGPLGWSALLAPLGLAAGFALAPRRWPRTIARIAAPRVALSLWAAAALAGAIAGRGVRLADALLPPAPPAPATLAHAPNLLLV